MFVIWRYYRQRMEIFLWPLTLFRIPASFWKRHLDSADLPLNFLTTLSQWSSTTLNSAKYTDPNVLLPSSSLILREFHENSGNSKGRLRFLERWKLKCHHLYPVQYKLSCPKLNYAKLFWSKVNEIISVPSPWTRVIKTREEKNLWHLVLCLLWRK